VLITEKKMGKAKEFIGTVISNKMQKTLIVSVVRASKHPKYGRIIKQYNKFKVHDEKNSAGMGDRVRIRETRPLSKDKRFKLLEILHKTEVPAVEIKE
jgi:small subunit ribosomal protein S17